MLNDLEAARDVSLEERKDSVLGKKKREYVMCYIDIQVGLE